MTDYTLKDLITINNGKDYRHLKEGTIPVYGSGGIMCYVDEFLNEGESILLPRKGTLDNIIYVTGKFWTVDTMYWATVNPELADARYLYLYLTQLDLSNLDTGSTLPSMTYDTYNMVPVILPDIETQHDVADKIFTIREKIALNNSICSDFESMAKLLYDYWFVQFDFPDEKGKPYKSSGGRMIWNEELKREIPEGWSVGNLYDIADFINGLACQKFRPTDDKHKLPVIKIGEMHDGFRDDVEWARDDVPSKNIINNGDILFSWSATLEVMIWNKGKGVLNQHIFKVVPQKYNRYYVFQQLSAYIINFVRMAESRKTTMGHITTDHLKQSRIAIPPKEIANKYGTAINEVYDIYLLCANENQQLTELRDFLLPMLMNGQVKVKG